MITHVLKDGTKLNDISGRVVKQGDFKNVYEIIKRIENRGKDEGGRQNAKAFCRSDLLYVREIQA